MYTPFNLSRVRLEFPIVNSSIYVNHAAVGPISLSVQQRMIAQSELHLQKIDDAGGADSPVHSHCRELAGKLVNVGADQIAFIQNTSDGMSLIANGIEWGEDDNVVFSEMEFPSNYLPWTNLLSKGVQVRRVPAGDGRLTPDKVHRYIDENTRIVALSHVQYYNGFRTNLAAFGELCDKSNALLVVDGTQSIGALRADVSAAGVDALVVSAHKWMLGGLGIGFMALSHRALNRLSVPNPGWLSVNEPFAMRRKLDLLPSASRYEPGTKNSIGIFGLDTRLQQIHETRISEIERRVLALTDQLCERVTAKGYTLTCSRRQNEKSGIVTFCHNDIPSEAVFARLEAANVSASVRNGSVRISPHYYNSEHEIELIGNALPE